jgi:hypothetical protein
MRGIDGPLKPARTLKRGAEMVSLCWRIHRFELLVVMALVSVLAPLWLPALSKGNQLIDQLESISILRG